LRAERIVEDWIEGAVTGEIYYMLVDNCSILLYNINNIEQTSYLVTMRTKEASPKHPRNINEVKK
jgi:hypothetical protein